MRGRNNAMITIHNQSSITDIIYRLQHLSIVLFRRYAAVVFFIIVIASSQF